jgi:hypothetical protein
MGNRFALLLGCVGMMIGSIAVGCTTHTHERPDTPPATVIHQDMSPPSSSAREGAREGVRDTVTPY